jgi:catechol 2,3-dioxygenase-like lactoylglutathione lyase family enzyme
VDIKLEVVVVPVSDVDRAKRFYETLGFRLDIDHVAGEDFRVVQLTPPGSESSIIIGNGITSATPGSVQGLQLVAVDIEAAAPSSSAVGSTWERCSTTRAGCSTTSGPSGRKLARIRNAATMPRLPRSVIRTATVGCSKR